MKRVPAGKVMPILVGLCTAIAGCATGGRDALNSTPPMLKSRIHSEEAVPAPEWTLRDCVETAGVFHFVGYGEGEDQDAALRAANLKARQGALVCIFGGRYSIGGEVNENETKVSVSSRISMSLDVEQVEWQGFTFVRAFFSVPSRTRIFVEYTWDTKEAKNSKARFDKLKAQLDKTKALQDQVAIKSKLIADQQEELDKLKIQERQLREISGQMERAQQFMLTMRKTENTKNASIRGVMNKIYCGMTMGQLIDLIGHPEEGADDACYKQIRWGEFVVSSECVTSGKVTDEQMRAMRINHVRDRHGYGGFNKVCGSL